MKNQKKLDGKKSFGTNAKQMGKGKSQSKKPVMKSAGPKVPGEWFYMCPAEITVEEIQKALSSIEKIDLEIWKEMGVLEAELVGQDEKIDLDFSLLENDLEDEYSNQFLQEHDVKTLYAVSFKPETYEQVKTWMLTVKSALGGFFCGDTDDFTPVL